MQPRQPADADTESTITPQKPMKQREIINNLFVCQPVLLQCSLPVWTEVW